MAECNNCLTLDRLVTVDIEVEQVFDQADFGSISILTDETNGAVGGGASVLTTANYIKEYTTFDAVASDWDSSSAVYGAAQSAFAQTPRASVIKVILMNFSTNIENQLNELFLCEDSQGILTPTLRSVTHVPSIMEIAVWTEARRGKNFYFVESDDIKTKDPNDATSLAALMKEAAYRYTSVYYNEKPSEYFAAASLSYSLGQDLDADGSAFTLAYKTLSGITPTFISDAEVTAITGVIPSAGCSRKFGHFANVYVCVAGVNMMMYGHMADGNYLDTALLSEFLKARIQERISDLLRTGQIPQTQDGYNQLADQVSFMLAQAQSAGWLIGNNTVGGQTGYSVFVPDITTSTRADRQCRITSPIQFKATLAGRVHHTSVSGLFQF